MPITREQLANLSPAQLAELDRLLLSDPMIWRPLVGPQSRGYRSKADVLGFGGAAGGGKTAVIIGLALTQHQRTLILRREATQLRGIIDEMISLGGRNGYNGSERVYRLGKRVIEFGSAPVLGDESKYQGRPHDLLCFDEATAFAESQVRYLLGWLRTTIPNQRCRCVLTFNPPTTVEGRWIIDFFGPWLDKNHPKPAQPGELRWYTTISGKDVECDGPDLVEVDGEYIRPLSRTFIPSRVTDNPYLMETGYLATLQALPEPLRSQMLHGDFNAGVEDDAFQVIPTEWVEMAMARWERPRSLPLMDSLGVDVARGGADETVIARRHGTWFDIPLVYPGAQTPDGPTLAGLTVAASRDGAVIHIDVIGVGASPYDFLNQAKQQVIGVNVAERSNAVDRSGRLGFKNIRSQLWWRMREALDPKNNVGIALPKDKRLLADLTAATWQLAGDKICVASREELVKKLGRSPDYASAYVLALIDTPARITKKMVREYNPYESLKV